MFEGRLPQGTPAPTPCRKTAPGPNPQNSRDGVACHPAGWAQVHGRNAIDWEEKFRHDLWYVDHWSLGLAFKILLLTVVKVVRREGISGKGAATMVPFRGSSRGEIRACGQYLGRMQNLG